MTFDPEPEKNLPFSYAWPIAAGAVLGVVLRLVYFRDASMPYNAMGLGFVFFAPIAVGAVTVYFGERQRRRTLGVHIVATLLATIAFVGGTIVILIEGLVCAIIIVPLFCVLALFGAGAMLIVCRITNWPTRAVSGIVLLPLALGAVDTHMPLPDNVLEVERSIVIGAPPEKVWHGLLDARDIRPGEVGDAWVFRIGVPVPLEGQLLDGRGLDSPMPARRVRMAKDVYFDELVTDARPNEFIRWTYAFYPDSFPPYALDEHVRVGGRYFDVRDTAYTLTRRGNSTELDVRIGVRVSTRFNWYANPAARFLIGNLAEANLAYYKRRSEDARQ